MSDKCFLYKKYFIINKIFIGPTCSFTDVLTRASKFGVTPPCPGQKYIYKKYFLIYEKILKIRAIRHYWNTNQMHTGVNNIIL